MRTVYFEEGCYIDVIDWVHPSKRLIGEESSALQGKKVVLGVTGSVACYRSVDLARKLMRRGAEVYVVMSESAADLVSPELFRWATGNPVMVEFTGDIEHVEYAEYADSMIIAPATANTVSKIAHGVADTSVTLTALTMRGAEKPVGVVPVMHLQLYKSPQMSSSVERLKSLGYHVLDPLIEADKAKMPEVEDIAHFTEAMTLRGRDLEGLKLLVTAGPTREYLDPVRFLTNPSSGRMGVALAKEAFFRGSSVTLVHGPLSVRAPPWVKCVEAETTDEYLKQVLEELSTNEYHVAILAGAPIDYRFERVYESKLESADGPLNVKLQLTPKVVEAVRKRFPDIYLVGFAAETVKSDEELVERAEMKLKRYSLNMVVANNVARKDIGFMSTMNEVYVIDEDGCKVRIPKASKEEVARVILDLLESRVKKL